MGNPSPWKCDQARLSQVLSWLCLPYLTFRRAQAAPNTLQSELDAMRVGLLSKNIPSALRLLNSSLFEGKMHSESRERDWNTTGSLRAPLCHYSTAECPSPQQCRASENLSLLEYDLVSLCITDHRKEWKLFDGSFPTIQYWFGCEEHNLAIF